MRVLHVSHSDLAGGAARASYRLHRALLRAGMASEMIVAHKVSDDPAVREARRRSVGADYVTRRRLGNLLLRLQHSPDASFRSLNFVPSNLARELNASDADVVNLHWIGAETLSIADLGRVSKPLVWTLHDMWPFCGAEHYPADDAVARFRKGYRADNRCAGSAGPDLDRWTWNRKRACWRAMHLVAPSRWLARCAGESVLMAGWPLDVIPNPVDTSVYAPREAGSSRRTLGVPLAARLVLFGAAGGSADPRKGFTHVVKALRRLERRPGETVMVGIFGGGSVPPDVFSGYEVRDFGVVNDEDALVSLYCAADVFVAPSEMDNLPNTVVEALSCGTPVVAFKVGGFPDMVTSGQQGYLATPYDEGDLAKGIRWVLDHADPAAVRRAARAQALSIFDEAAVAARYAAVYQRAAAPGAS